MVHTPPIQNALKPGKGFSGDLTKETLLFLTEALNTIRRAYMESGGDARLDEVGPVVIYDEMCLWLNSQAKSDASIATFRPRFEWHSDKDTYGHKMYTDIPWAVGWNGHGATVEPGAYRVTLVLTRSGLKVDIRAWYR